MDVKIPRRKEIQARKRSNGEQVTYTCGDCDTRKERFCPSKRKKDCGEKSIQQKNCETRPCPLWSEWTYKDTDDSKNSLCWNELNDKQHFCHADSNLRRRNDPSQIGTRTKFRDCQGKKMHVRLPSLHF